MERIRSRLLTFGGLDSRNNPRWGGMLLPHLQVLDHRLVVFCSSSHPGNCGFQFLKPSPPRPGRGDRKGMCGTPPPGLSALRSALLSVPRRLSHRVPEPGPSGSLSEVTRTRHLLLRSLRRAEQGAASPGVRDRRRSPHCPPRPTPRPRRLRATPLEAPPCRWRQMHGGRRPQVRAESAAQRLAEGSETPGAAAAGPGTYL